ncbi:MAG: YqaJ viral recombinase family protein [Clostridia bacterium]|nr:YqaJ viral recombinase family protein [Clostridia bacterium]
MSGYTVFADVRQLTRADWLRLRRSGIGGSDAAAVMGLHPYKGPFAVYADKLGAERAEDESEAMRQGRDLEEYVARRFAEASGLRLRREYGMLRSTAHPCMIADIDRRIIGERAGLECKTSKDLHLARYRNGDYPLEYYAQCLHYLAVTGWDRWYLAVLVYGTGLLTFTIEQEAVRDDLEALIKAEEAFWRDHVERRQPPPPDGLEATSAALLGLYPRAGGQTMDAGPEDETLMAALLDMKKRRKALDRDIAEAENRVKARMGEAEALNGTSARATWKNQARRTISEKKLRELYPQVDVDSVKAETSARVFKVRGEESEE